MDARLRSPPDRLPTGTADRPASSRVCSTSSTAFAGSQTCRSAAA
jgi:hypothetical protein